MRTFVGMYRGFAIYRWTTGKVAAHDDTTDKEVCADKSVDQVIVKIDNMSS